MKAINKKDRLLAKEKSRINEWVRIYLGIISIAIAIHFFLIPNNISLGGATGLATVISHITKLSPSVWFVLINLVLFMVGFLILGKSFGTRTVISSFSLSALVWLLDLIAPVKEPLFDDLWIQLVCSVIIYGAGVGLVLNNYSSTGGSDIAAKILNHYFGLDVGTGCLIADLLIICSAGLVFGKEVFIYSFVGVVLNGRIISTTIRGINSSKLCSINTTKTEEVIDYLLSLTRSANIYQVTGAYTKEKRVVIKTVVSNRDFVALKRYITKIDPNAFIVVSDASETYGYGWQDLSR